MIILAVDLGKTRTGIAVSDKSESFAFPRDVIYEHSREKLWLKIKEASTREKAELIVMGLPKNMNGTEGEKAEESRQAAEEIRKASGLEVELYDERCTTVMAHQNLMNCGIRAKNRKNLVDSAAAVLILESFMSWRKNQINI